MKQKPLLHILLCTCLIIIPHLLFAQHTHITGPSGSGQFGYSVTVLTNGNFVVVDRLYDEGATADVGAVYLYDGSSLALISTLKGSTAGDQVGSSGVIALSSGNYVVRSPNWDNGAAANAGAVSWGNGLTGISGIVSSSNSLVGSSLNDNFGVSNITVLSNGNYVVRSASWNNGPITDAGAVTWCNGATGRTGTISSSNSLVGSNTNDNVGGSGVTALTNGNYVVGSPFWDNGAVSNAGAVTWGNGASGISGIVSSSNSLVGSTANDQVGFGITALTNGNYVVASTGWDDASATNAGAVTWGNGTTGITGAISSSNSLVGSNTNDQVGGSGVTALTNGNYVVRSQNWDNGAASNAGAVTWGNGTTGITGTVSSSNSLVGSTANDNVGSSGVTALTNGNYVVSSSSWNNGAITGAGAATWGNGTTGITGAVSSSNSLVGSTANDNVGNSGVTALTNGNYVVRSYSWNNGAITGAGAVTWGNGTTGITGAVSSSNSLVGSTANDNVGSFYDITALSNGNYVVSSPEWNNGAVTDAGAATWGNGATGTSGAVSSSNSLVGSTAFDRVGENFGGLGVTALTNGNYVVSSPNWNNGAAAYVGAATWGNGTTGISGVINSSNSLVGSTANNRVGVGGTRALTNGNYVVRSSSWDDGVITDVGAITWGNGTTGITGTISSTNSLVGSAANDFVGNDNLTALPDGNYVVKSPDWDHITATDVGVVTWGNGSMGVSGTVTTCKSVIGIAISGGNLLAFSNNSIYDYLVAGRPSDNMVTIYRPSGMSLANSLDEVAVNIAGSTPVPLIANGSCRVIATLTANGASPVAGVVNIKTWVEPSVPTHAGQPYVARHYEITPASNASTATGRITLYFTQQEFTDFNNHAGSTADLPAHPTDAAGKANLRIGKYPGTSNNGTGLPGTYTAGSAGLIDPVDSDIIWNSSLSRWEVSFNVTGFSGFIVQTHTSVLLPLTLLEFNGMLNTNDAILTWKTTNENNTAEFVVERSTDGRSYTTAGNIRAVNQPGTNAYSFTDFNAALLQADRLYYRLRQKDIDGRQTWSRVIVLPLAAKNFVLLYPNPAVDDLAITISITKANKLQLRIMDNTGRIVHTKQINSPAGSSTHAVDISRMAAGVYYLELTGEAIIERMQFVKQ